jgi:hypothetical protein
MATIVPDSTWPGMWRVRMPDGHLTDMVNLTRAKDAAQSLALAVLNEKPLLLQGQSGDDVRP